MAEILVTQLGLEVLVASGASAAASSVSLSARLVWIVSSTSTVANVIVAHSTPVSAEWVVSGGISAFTYSYTLADMTNVAGFVSTATTSALTRTYTGAGGNTLGTRRISSTVSDASGASLTSSILVHVRATTVPNPLDGRVYYENQFRRQVIPT